MPARLLLPDRLVRGQPYTDPACPTGDRRDKHVRGLLLAKTGPTPNVASAVAQIGESPRQDADRARIRHPQSRGASDPRGSHCGAGAPRFNVVTADGSLYFLGCNSPPAEVAEVGDGWIRSAGAAPRR